MERDITHIRGDVATAISQVLQKAQSQPVEVALARGSEYEMKLRQAESIFKEGQKHQERHLIVSDFQIPDHDKKAIGLVHQFIDDFHPSHVHINGDFLNFTPFSRYDVLAGKQAPPIQEEIKQGRQVLTELTNRARKADPNAEVIWYEGNHEARLFKFIVRQALGSKSPLLDLELDGEEVLSIPHLFKLKELGVEWVPERKSKKIHDFFIEHGDMVRKYAGYTGQGMMERKGSSGTTGHTHRLALVSRTNATKTMFWIESGSLCHSRPSPQYAKDADWQKGFGVMIYDKRKKQVYPAVVPIIKNSFMFGGKLYR